MKLTVAGIKIKITQAIEDHCDAQITSLLTQEKKDEQSANYALAYRYFKRITSHSFNVLTSIVQPIDKIDFSESRPSTAQ